MTIEDSALITLANPRSAVAEAYRTLRTNIQLSSLDNPVRSLMIASASQDEEKSTTLANLAVTFAQAGNQVVIVDSDLRRPSQHRLFGVENDRGLTTMLLQDETSEPPLVATGVEGLRLLPSGPLPPNPGELLASRRVEKAIATLRELADLVLFDAPPVLAVSDAAVLSRRVDAVLLAVDSGRTKRDHAARARQTLERAGARVLGVVLTSARVDRSVHSYYS